MTMPTTRRSLPAGRPGRAGRWLAVSAGAVLLTGALAGCGSAGTTTPPPSATSSAASSSSVVSSSPAVSSSTAPAASAGSSAPSGPPTTGGGPTGTGSLASPSVVPGGPAKLTGTIEAGVEAGCLVLTGPDGAVVANLVGLDAATTPTGVQVEVSGRFATDMMTTCQQGQPFAVAEVVEK